MYKHKWFWTKEWHDCICFSWIIYTLFAINTYMALYQINQITVVTSLKSTISSECMLRRVGVCGIKWLIVIIWPTWSLVTFQLNCTALWIWLSSISCAGETKKWWLGQTRGSLQYCSIHFSKINIILNQQFEYGFYNNPYLKKEQIIVSTHNNFDQNKLCILEFYITFTTWHP